MDELTKEEIANIILWAIADQNQGTISIDQEAIDKAHENKGLLMMMGKADGFILHRVLAEPRHDS